MVLIVTSGLDGEAALLFSEGEHFARLVRPWGLWAVVRDIHEAREENHLRGDRVIVDTPFEVFADAAFRVLWGMPVALLRHILNGDLPRAYREGAEEVWAVVDLYAAHAREEGPSPTCIYVLYLADERGSPPTATQSLLLADQMDHYCEPGFDALARLIDGDGARPGYRHFFKSTVGAGRPSKVALRELAAGLRARAVAVPAADREAPLEPALCYV